MKGTAHIRPGNLQYSDMQIRILGASGGIGDGARTTSLLVDGRILIDAGTGVADLALEQMAAIDHIFLTHAHLDHVACIPFLADSVGSRRRQPLVVHAQAATLDVLRQHVFNNALWPDFTVIPSAEKPYLRFEELAPGASLTLDGRRFQSIPVSHSIPAVGYLVGNGRASLAFSGDTSSTEAFWAALNDCADLKYLLVETSFTDEEEALSRLSGHLCPRLLAQELEKLTRPATIYITHLMPGEEQAIMSEIHRQVPQRLPQALMRDMVLDL
jgi:cAMP phosphodiesterase